MNTDQFVYFINSYLDRTPSDYTHSWTTYFSEPVRVSGKKRMKLQLQNIELPNTAYTFPEASSILWVNIWDGVSAWILKSYSVATDRNFNTPSDFVTYINTLTVADSLVFSYDANTCRMTLTNNNANKIRVVGSYRYQDSISTTYNNIIDRLGFTQDLTSAEVASSGTLEGETILRLLRTNRYYITCSNLGNYSKQSRVPSPYVNPYIIACVASSNFGRISQLEYGNAVFFYTNELELKSLKFEILDDEFQSVQLNECPVTFSLLIETESK